MSFDNILADCLALLDAGITEDECLVRYPDHAEQLASILQIAAQLRNQPAPHLPSQAFTSGRAALRAEAKRQQELMASHRRPSAALVAPAVQHRAEPQHRWRPRTLPRQRVPRIFSAFHLMTGVLVAALVLLSGYTIARSTSDSLPGDHIYAIKRLGENVEGLLMNAVGQSAAWHMQQAERRLEESLALEMRGQTPDPAVAARINASVQSAINASTDMSSAERTAFLAFWLDNLRSLQTVFSTAEPFIAPVTSAPAAAPSTAGAPHSVSPALPSNATLSQTIDTVEMAAENHANAQPLPLTENTDNASSAESMIETMSKNANSVGSVELPTPTIPPTDTAGVTPTHTYTPTSTQTYTPTPHPTATSTPTPHPTATPTWTMTPPPTNTPTRSSSGGGDRPTKTPTHTPWPTDTSTPQPTDTPAPVESATATVTPGDAMTGTPATPEPIGTETAEPSGTPATPVPTGEVTTTPEPSGTPATPVLTEEPTATPPPDSTAADIPTNTPSPTEQVITATAPAVLATPTPDNADIGATETPIP